LSLFIDIYWRRK